MQGNLKKPTKLDKTDQVAQSEITSVCGQNGNTNAKERADTIEHEQGKPHADDMNDWATTINQNYII